jgi:hypothetical protein
MLTLFSHHMVAERTVAEGFVLINVPGVLDCRLHRRSLAFSTKMLARVGLLSPCVF